MLIRCFFKNDKNEGKKAGGEGGGGRRVSIFNYSPNLNVPYTKWFIMDNKKVVSFFY